MLDKKKKSDKLENKGMFKRKKRNRKYPLRV